ncbi:hypothetical protein [Thermomonospora amylolytica]|uniref:hypothetical protein n=1 Tax=Thermomonospora amylolytica TaxID=1411117 RepID=UPI001300285F|nr:hypothetical protein [Thermomonospora amylolytica]
MGVSIYYTATRGTALTDEERDRVQDIVTESNEALFAGLNTKLAGWKAKNLVPAHMADAWEFCEGLHLYKPDENDPRVILAGSSKVSHSECGMEPMYAQLDHYMRVALPRLRRALPDAEWRVHVDDIDLEWDEEDGQYTYPDAP